MTTRTRYFLVGSLLTLAVGLGVGLVAYSTGLTSTSAFTRQGGPDELQFVPANAAVVAYADVRDIMTSDLRQRLRSALPMKHDGQQEFQTQTGINIETDIDHVIAGVVPTPDQAGRPGSAIVLARGRFDQVKIESLMREHGAQVEDYHGTRLVVGDTPRGNATLSLAFLEPGLVAVGSSALVRGAVDLKGGGASITTNDEIMRLIREIDSGNAWAAGRFDALTSQARFPNDVAQQLPSITFFSASATIDSGIRATLRAESRDEESANSLRDLVRGFVALAKMQASSRPDVATLLQTLQLGGTGKTVSLSFDLPSSAIDALAAIGHRAAQSAPQR